MHNKCQLYFSSFLKFLQSSDNDEKLLGCEKMKWSKMAVISNLIPITKIIRYLKKAYSRYPSSEMIILKISLLTIADIGNGRYAKWRLYKMVVIQNGCHENCRSIK